MVSAPTHSENVHQALRGDRSQSGREGVRGRPSMIVKIQKIGVGFSVGFLIYINLSY